MDAILNIFNDEPEESKQKEENVGIDENEESKNNNETNKQSEKEIITESLETRSPNTENDLFINLELGDIIEIIAPTNSDINEMVVIITYIDNEKLKLINVTTYQHYKLNITSDGFFTDESITQINILSRSNEKGYARQNNLLPHTWIDLHFGGDIPAIITGEITNLEADMIEITTFPELRVIYINFGYKGIPENIPINKIIIRSKPVSVTVSTLSLLRGVSVEGESLENDNFEEQASMEFTDSGESIISVSKDVAAEPNIREQLHELYMEANEIVFGEKLGEVYQLVEIPEENQRYGIELQVNDMMDELLSTIPNIQRTKTVLDNICLLIERYKQLRLNYSKFDKNGNIYDVKIYGASHKPLIENLKKINKKLLWILPIVATNRKLYDVGVFLDSKDIVLEKLSTSLEDLENKQLDYYKNNSRTPLLEYNPFCEYIQDFLTPFNNPTISASYLDTISIEENIDTLVSNLENFYSSVYTKSGITKKQYIMQRYNLGFSGLDEQLLNKGKKIYFRKNITNNDSMVIRSLFMLPEPVIRYSSVLLPSTNLLDKSNLSHHSFLLFRFLKKKLEIDSHNIDDFSKEINYEKIEKNIGKSIFSNVNEFFINNGFLDKNKYQKFLETIIPKTRFLIRLIRKYLNNRLSFIDVVKKLEVFSIYPEDISYKQYLEIRYIIKERIEEIKVEIEKRSHNFNLLRNAKYNLNKLPNEFLRLLNTNKNLSDSFFKSYEFFKNYKVTDINKETNEILNKIIEIDNGILYTNIIQSLLISLITPSQLLDVLSEPKIDDTTDIEKIKPSDCSRKYLAKRYTTISSLQKDNIFEDIYFDKDLDDTPYSIIDKYSKEKKEMSIGIFKEFLMKTLIDKHDCPSNMADELANTLILGKKIIKDGDYAMLDITPKITEDMYEQEKTIKIKNSKFHYYRRLKNNWVRDNDIEENSFLDTSSLFCNINEQCYSSKTKTTSVCETLDESAERMRKIAQKKMMNEFDRRYDLNVEELEKTLEKTIHLNLKHLKKLFDLRELQRHKCSRLAYSIGNMASNIELIQSPHLKLRDFILGQDDFSKKQVDICRFFDMFCREPLVEQQDEELFWKYCKDTNTKLLPASILELAKAFVMGLDYTKKLADVCRKYGIISDDGDSIVDKYSGFVLRKIDFSSEEGFDEAGYRITTNEIMEGDLGAIIADANKKNMEKRVFENETTETVFHILSALCHNIDIPIESVDEFVLQNSVDMFDKIIYSEASYKKKSDKQLKEKGKPLQPYQNYRDETRITVVACNLLIAIQIAIPSILGKKTFPGCIRSFSGYPLLSGVEDLTGIQYMACVLNKTSSSIGIWESIKKYKSEILVKRMKDIFDNFIMKRVDILELYTRKREYMLLNPELVSIQEHSIRKWLQFLPPLVPISLPKSLQNVASDFENDLISIIRGGGNVGNHKQSDKICVVKSKILFFGYGIIEIIQDIVEKKDVLLKSSGNVPFLENACCNQSLELTHPIKYFNEENKQIALYIRNVSQLTRILELSRNLEKAPFLYHPYFTGFKYSIILSNSLDNKDLIYSTIIHYCNFDKNLPIPEKFKEICNEKIEGYESNWSLDQKIEFLKKNAHQYKVDDLLRLMNIVNMENIVDVSYPSVFNKIDVTKDIIEHLDLENSKVVDEPLRKLFFRLLESYKLKTMSYEISNELNDLKNYLIEANKNMYREIMDFFGRYGNLSDRKYSQLHDFMKNICVWKIDKPLKETNQYYDTGLYTIYQFIQNAVQSMSITYPNILLNDVGFYKQVHNHWGFSTNHNNILSQFISKYYEKLEQFKEDRIINRLLQDITVRLKNLNMFLKNIPITTEIVKDFGETVEGETIRNFYLLLDKPTIYLIFSYCFYSVFYEYIDSTNDSELLRADIEDIKKVKRQELRDSTDVATQLSAGIDEDNGLNEVDIQVGNKEELKLRVASLLLSFLEIEEENKKTIDFTYEDIQQKVRRNKDIERRSIIDRLTKMSIEQRKVENSLKKYRLEHWNVGQQRGLYEYDKETFDREIENLVLDNQDAIDQLEVPDVPDEYDIDQLNNNDRAEQENFEGIDYGRGVNIDGIHIEDGEYDGDYYYNDNEEGDFRDD